MKSQVMYLLLLFCVCLITALPHHHDGHDSDPSEEKGLDMDVKVSPDSQGGHQMSNNHFSTSRTDDDANEHHAIVTSGHSEMTTETSLLPEGDDHQKVSIPPEVPTTHKVDAKKDPKKKAKPTLKKKDRNFESEESFDNSSDGSSDVTTTKEATHTTSDMDTTTLASHSTTNEREPDSMSAAEGTTMHPEIIHKSMNVESSSETATDMETESALPSTTKNENLLSSDEQPPQTTIHETLETTSTTTPIETEESATETEAYTTELSTPQTNVPETEPTMAPNALTDIENVEAVPSTISPESTDMEMTKSSDDQPMTTISTTTLASGSDNDNNSLSNDLEDRQKTTTEAPEFSPEVANNRKQKQMNLEGGCPCNERETTLDPAECVGGRTTADPNCPCREVCARQSGQSCSPGEPCDEMFGLNCNPQNNTCTGQLSIRVLDVTHNSAKITWGMSQSELQPQALVYYTSMYRGPHTQWIKVHDIKPVITLENLLPNKNYYVKVEEDGKQEISTFRTKDGCLFNSTLSYGVGQLFNVSCSETCICYSGGAPECHDRCEYKPSSNLPSSCSEIPDENDACCIRLLCRDNMANNMPKILVKQKSQTTLTVVWDDFRLPSYHSEYILEYKPASDPSQNWTKVQAGTQTIVTVTHLMPNTPYEIKVAVWEDDKLELPSEVITAYTADGCVRAGRMYDVGEEFFVECNFRCKCNGNNESDCSPRCNAPYVKIGSKTDDPQCYEKALPSDPCCVIIRCTESKALEDLEDIKNKSGDCPEIHEDSESESKSCLSDCDHDRDCHGPLKCCPSSCGGAVCVQPLVQEDVCEHVYCGPNAECVSSKMACVCSEGYEGNPHDFLSGCVPANSTMKMENNTDENRSEFELDLSHKESEEPKTEMTTVSTDEQDADSKNELSPDGNDKKEAVPTDAPFELDLTAHHNSLPDESANETSNAPSDEENLHFRRPQKDREEHRNEDVSAGDVPSMDEKNTTETSILFDGCEFNNITYDRGVKFEDGCDAFCICEGQGHVSCVPRCNVLSSGGPACREVPDPDDSCCKIMVCSFPGNSDADHVEALPIKILSALAQNGNSVRVRIGISASHLPTMVGRDIFEVWYRESFEGDNDLSQWYKKPISQEDLTEIQQGVFEFDITGLSPQTDYYIKVGRDSQGTGLNMAEFSNTVNVKTFPAAVKTVFQGCFHHNQSYSLGEVFYQGCEHKCICREKGFIECQDRCAIYIDAVGFEECDWVQSEEDPCCSVPLCNRRKIPLMIDERPPPGGPPGPPDNICVVSHNEVYRVGDIWESADGCKMKICRCNQLPNGTTSIQCQSECPPLPPNAHIPTARCPHPILIKPDGPCKCPYVSCEEAPPRRIIQAPRPQCEFKGERYNMGQEFYDGCIALCHCGQDLRVNCAAIECPYHFGADFTNCLEWDIDPDFFPVPPKCCAPAKCKNDGSCMFNGGKFQNFEMIPEYLLPCSASCQCKNGNVTCENKCPPLEDVPPANLPCPPNMAYKGHPEGESCCLQWMCKEPTKQAYCMFQGSRYLVNEKWEVHKQNQLRTCVCHMDSSGHPEVECREGCPKIPQRFLLPTEQCLRPVVVNPDDPLMCPYVVCNNTISGQDLYNVNVVALNSTAVRIRFSLSSILVGLIGHAELHFTTDPTLPPSQWHIQKFSRPKRLFDSPNIEYVLNALRPNTTYFLQVKIKIDTLQGGPESELFKLKMPEEIVPTTTLQTTTTTTVPPMIIIDARPEAHVVDSRTVKISWKNIDLQEKKYIYALQLRYKMRDEADDKWITTPMIHRDVTSYFLHDLEPLADYVVEMIFTPPKDVPTKILSQKGLEFKTPGKAKDDYHLQVSVEDNKVGSDNSAFYFAGIPEPIPKHVHVIKIMYKTADGEQSYSFKVPKSNHITLDHLKPGKKYLAQLELYLTNGQTLTSNEVEFITKPMKEEKTSVSQADNTISHENHESAPGKSAELLQSTDSGSGGAEDENKAYFIALVVVAVVAAVAGFGFVLLLVLLVRRQASAKAPISRTPSESAYDNPTYKTYDGERPEDKTNGNIQTTQA